MRNIDGLLSATGKRRRQPKYTGSGEIELEFGASGGHFEYLWL